MSTRSFYIGTVNTTTPLDEEIEQFEIFLSMTGIPIFRSPEDIKGALLEGHSVRVLKVTVELGDVYTSTVDEDFVATEGE